jgi:hypothetical protein
MGAVDVAAAAESLRAVLAEITEDGSELTASVAPRRGCGPGPGRRADFAVTATERVDARLRSAVQVRCP